MSDVTRLVGGVLVTDSELTDVVVEWLAPEERSFSEDAFRISKASAVPWTATRAEVEAFVAQLQRMLRVTEGAK